jgi:TonB-linked SusC/RagA family outer membrane protein
MKFSFRQNKVETVFPCKAQLLKLTSIALFSLLALVFSLPAVAQNITVKGRITNETGQPVPSASVSVKGTTAGASSGIDGNFEISAPSKGTLIITSVGYAPKEVSVNGQTTLNIRLGSSSTDLEQVVVVGYGTQRRKDITGSIVSVTEKALDEVPANNLTMALQGRAAGVDIARVGVRPSSGGQIRIRGNRSLSGSNDPLIVLDGFVYQGNINDLNVDDVANIDILKDASATAIYGSRGSNGVIIITTKRGRTGKPVVSYNGTLGMTQITDQFPLFNADEFYAFKAEARYGAPSGTTPAVFTPAELAGKAAGTNTNWQDYLYRKGIATSHDLSLSGGTDVTQYGMGLSYLDQEGVIPLVEFERYGLRVTIDQKIGKRIKIGLSTLNTLSYNYGDGVGPTYNTGALSPLVSPYNPDGSINVQPMVGHQDVGARLNPLTLTRANAVLDRRRRIRTFNTLYAELQIIEGLKYRFNLAADFRQDNYGNYFAANTVLSGASGTPFASNTAQISNGEAWTYDMYHQLIYEKTIATNHRLNVTALYEVQQDQTTNSQFTGTGIPADYVQNTNFSNLVSAISAPNNNNISNPANGFVRSGIVSYMGRVNYTFKDRYNLTVTYRRDGSSRLAEGNKWFNYPSVGVSWNAANESFMKSVSWVSNLKLRAGWGKTANQSATPYSTLGPLSGNNYNFGSSGFVTGYYVNSLPNPSLGWENTEVVNLGLDFGLFKNRISGSIDVYKAKTSDIIVTKQLPISNGANSITTNAAKTESKGVEIILSGIIFDNKDGFRWSADVNWSLNREKITALEEPGKIRDVGNGWFVGQPLNVIYDFKKIGIWQTKDAATIALFGAPQAVGRIRVADLDGDNKITTADQTVLGSAQPKWVGGITNRFAYKDFDLSVVTFARWGGTIVATYFQSNNGGSGGWAFFEQARVNQWKIDYWTPTNPTDKFPHPEGQALNDNYASTLGYYDGSFIRVRSINLGYTLPTKLLSKAAISSMRAFVSITNPFIVYSPFVRDGYGIDPEGTGTGTTLGAFGGSNATPNNGRAILVGADLPPTRQFTFGINVKF